MRSGSGTNPRDVVGIVASVAMVMSLVLFFSAFVMRRIADKGHLLGNVAYPMGKDALDPVLNRQAREWDLEIGRRGTARFWSLWPVFVGLFIVGLIAVIILAITS